MYMWLCVGVAKLCVFCHRVSLTVWAALLISSYIALCSLPSVLAQLQFNFQFTSKAAEFVHAVPVDGSNFEWRLEWKDWKVGECYTPRGIASLHFSFHSVSFPSSTFLLVLCTHPL
jgi:hypothetical protein